jgi:hypothetical protein
MTEEGGLWQETTRKTKKRRALCALRGTLVIVDCFSVLFLNLRAPSESVHPSRRRKAVEDSRRKIRGPTPCDLFFGRAFWFHHAGGADSLSLTHEAAVTRGGGVAARDDAAPPAAAAAIRYARGPRVACYAAAHAVV